jgi:hypothetical protein
VAIEYSDYYCISVAGPRLEACRLAKQVQPITAVRYCNQVDPVHIPALFKLPLYGLTGSWAESDSTYIRIRCIDQLTQLSLQVTVRDCSATTASSLSRARSGGFDAPDHPYTITLRGFQGVSPAPEILDLLQCMILLQVVILQNLHT